MVLVIHSNISYPKKPKVQIRVGGHNFLSINAEFPPINSAVLNISQIIKVVMASAAKYELGGILIIETYPVLVHKALEEMVNPQPPKSKHTENYTAYGAVNKNIQQKATKSTDMRFHWL